MKSITFLLVAGVLGATACSQTHSDPAPTLPAYTVAWTTNNQSVKTGYYVTVVGNNNKNLVTIEGKDYINGVLLHSVKLELPQAVGTYSLNATTFASGTYRANSLEYYAGSQLSTGSGKGIIVVTGLTPTSISGTFTFTGIDSATNTTADITDGSFYVPI